MDTNSGTLAEQILRDLRVVADQLGTDRLTSRLYNEHRGADMLPSSTIRDRMGGWARACTEAGLVAAGQAPAKVPDEVVVGWMRGVAAHLETTVLTMSDYQEHAPADAITTAAICLRFGSWAAACDLAGLATSRATVRKGTPDSDLLANISAVATRLGIERLTMSRYNSNRSQGAPTAGTMAERFGSWTAACEKAGLAPERRRRHSAVSRAMCIESLRAAAVGGRLPPVARYEEARDRSETVPAEDILRVFSSWAAACRAADLEPSPDWGVAREDRIAQVRQTAERIGVVALSRSDYDRLRNKSQTTDSMNLTRTFGSWAEVCRLAGLSTGPNRRA